MGFQDAVATAVIWGEDGFSLGGGKGEGVWRRRRGIGGRGTEGGGRTDPLEISSDVPFAEKTADGNNAVDINRE